MKPDEPPLLIRRAQDVLVFLISGLLLGSVLFVATAGAMAILFVMLAK